MFENAFRNIDDALRKDPGCATELDYIEQTSWVLFLKYLEDYENEKKDEAKADRRQYRKIIKEEFSWSRWAAPKKADGKIDHNKARTGSDLLDFVNGKLFPYLKNFRISADHADSINYKIGEIFGEITNKMQSGYSLREVIDKVDELRFLSNDDKHELSSLYEDKIKNMGNAGRNGGEYYTPRPLIKAIVKVIDPKVGKKVYDGAVGSAGFLCEAYKHMSKGDISSKDYEKLQKDTFIGKEKKSLAYVIGIMNMILHGIEAPNIIHTNTLEENLADIEQRHKVDVVLANPPFGASERAEVRQNFPISTGETAYMFLQHFIKKLKAGGRCGMVIKNTFLSNSDNASVALRRQLLLDCNLFAVLDVPDNSFQGNGAKAVVLFFEKGRRTEKIWYYQPNVGRTLGKTSPLTDEDLAEFVELAATKANSENSWSVDVTTIDEQGSCDLSVRNPNVVEEVDERSPREIIAQIEELEAQTAKAVSSIKELL